MGFATKEPRRDPNYGLRESSSIRSLQASVAIPERCLPSELGWPTGPQKPVFSLKEEQALVRKLTFSSDMAEDVHHMWEELVGAKIFFSHQDAGTRASVLMK